MYYVLTLANMTLSIKPCDLELDELIIINIPIEQI